MLDDPAWIVHFVFMSALTLNNPVSTGLSSFRTIRFPTLNSPLRVLGFQPNWFPPITYLPKFICHVLIDVPYDNNFIQFSKQDFNKINVVV